MPAPLSRPARSRMGTVRWRLLPVLFVGITIAWIDRTNLGVAMPFMQDDLSLSPEAVGIALGVFSFVQIFSQPTGGWLVDKVGVRLLFSLSALSWFVLTAATALVRGAASLIGLRFLLGIGEGPMAPSANKSVAEWFPKQERAFAISTYQVGSEFGPAITLPIVTGLIAVVGWRLSFVVTGLFGLFWAVFWYRFYRSPRQHPTISERELKHIEGGEARIADDDTAVRWRDLFRYRTIWGLILVMFCRGSVMYFFITWYPSYLIEARGFSLLEVGLYGAIPGLMAVVGDLAGGALSDLMMRRGASPTISRKLPILIGLLLGGAIAPAVLADDAMTSLVLLGVSSAGVAFAAGPLYAMMIEVAPSARNVGSATSLLNSTGAVASAVGPVLVGVLLGASGDSYVGPLLIAAGFMALGAVFLFTLVGKNERLPLKRTSTTETEPQH